jgi:hypothetical protein
MAPRLPRDVEELGAAQMANARIEGYGFEVTTVMPCPWCGTADWARLKIAEMTMEPGDYAVKGSCGRCGREGEIRVTRSPGETVGGFVQTGGPDAPEWLQPAPPRVQGA